VRARNAWLLTASLFFYAWGELGYVLVLIGSIAMNHVFGLMLASRRGQPRARAIVGVAIAANLALLGFFKYANFARGAAAPALEAIGILPPPLAPVHLPIGISFFTFQALTYVVDIHRGQAEVQRNPFRVALYIALFPQLVAGPIVRYQQVAAQLAHRSVSLADQAEGVRRFVIGLARKVLIANTLAVPADAIFATPAAELPVGVAWLGVACYTGQIFFDFAGYSDMAIGLGRFFGFGFPENFAAPYAADSIRVFWRRWHMSLSTWFRDYLYVPLGGNRMGSARTAFNLLAVFLLCGLWHGASWNFVVWGLVHGAFLALERGRFGRALARTPRVLRHAYTLFVVAMAWVFFRSDDLPHALGYLGALFGAGHDAIGAHPLALHLNAKVLFAGSVAVVLCVPPLTNAVRTAVGRLPVPTREGLRLAVLSLLFVLCSMSLAAGSHDPFIYFRF
jgi:alginate O-acetyltransferase complex protein AlgI